MWIGEIPTQRKSTSPPPRLGFSWHLFDTAANAAFNALPCVSDITTKDSSASPSMNAILILTSHIFSISARSVTGDEQKDDDGDGSDVQDIQQVGTHVVAAHG
jgi:hypothetical protein